MSDFHLNNSKLPRNDRFTQQIGAKARSWSSFGQIDRPFHSLSRGGPARLSEPRKQRRGGVAIFNRGPWVQWIPTRTKFSNWADGSSCLVLGVCDEFSVNRFVIRF